MSTSSPGPFTPLFDPLVQRYGVTTASVYGLVWRYCQIREGVCRASAATLAGRLSISVRTFIRQLDLLVTGGFIQDRTPNLRNRPHILAVNPQMLALQLAPASGPASAHSCGSPLSALPILPTSPGPALPGGMSDPDNLPQDDDTPAQPALPHSRMSQTLLRNEESDGLRDSPPQIQNPSAYSPADLWEYLYAELAPHIRHVDLLTWVQPSHPLSWDGVTLQVGVHNAYTRDWLASHLRSTASHILQGCVHNPSASLEFVVVEILHPPS